MQKYLSFTFDIIYKLLDYKSFFIKKIKIIAII